MSRAPFSGIEVFLTIVREGSLRAAARALGIGAPAVSHQLKTFERKIGVDLLVRTTRSIELSDAGRALLTRAGPAFQELADAIEDTREIGRSKTGTLRLTLPRSAFNLILSPVLGEFQDRYPDVRLDLSINEGLVDIVREGFHAGIRLGDLVAAEMISMRLTGPLTRCFSAAPGYLDRFGRPAHPRDLLNHKCIRVRFISAQRIAEWHYTEEGQTKTIDPPTKLIFDSFQSVMQAARDGHGIGWLLREVIQDDLRAGVLEAILDAYVTQQPPFYLYFPEQNQRLELLRLFIDFLAEKRHSHPRASWT